MRDDYFLVSWPRFLVGSGVFLVLTFTMLMPDISAGLTGVNLLLFWIVHVFGALAILQGVQMQLIRIQAVSKTSPWLQVLLSGWIGSLIFTPLAGFFDQIFGISEITDDENETVAEMLISEFTGSAGIVTLVWVGLNATRLVRTQPLKRPVANTTAPHAPTFWDHVPTKVGRDLVAVSAELHYIRIYTTEGQALILFPFGKAVAQLAEAVEGLQVHRSHWVSLSHVKNLERKGQGGVCRMSSGLAVPVSRRYMKELRTGLASER